MNEKATTNVFKDASITVDGNTIYSRGFIPFSDAMGLRYWPYDESNKEVSDYPYIFIPASGYKDYNGLTNKFYLWGPDTAYSSLWTEYAIDNDDQQARVLVTNPNLLGFSSYYRARALPVRCITDRNSELYSVISNPAS